MSTARYLVINPTKRVWVEVEAQSIDHARSVAYLASPDDFTDGKDGVWLDVAPVPAVPAASTRFREALSVADMPDRTREELLDLFQEALDETREAASTDGWLDGYDAS